jgi:thiamine-phosphate pyrophosphorylase
LTSINLWTPNSSGPRHNNAVGWFAESPLYAIVDTALGGARSLATIVDELLQAGVRVIQYRHKETFRRAHFDECCALASNVRGSSGLFLVNDRADVAALCGAGGVHLGQDDLPPAKARTFLGPDSIIGFSTHNSAQVTLADREPVDYIAIGPVFPTETKKNPDPVIGLEGVSEARRLTSKPLVAIGGITLENAPLVMQAGANAVAVASDLLRAADIEERAREFLAALRAARAQ